MKDKLQKIKDEAVEQIFACAELKQIEELRIKYLGKKGELTHILKQMGTLSAEERPVIGELANKIRNEIEEAFQKVKRKLHLEEQQAKFLSEKIDVTMDGRCNTLGHKHPMTNVIDELKQTFIGLGYQIAEGPEIELDYYNFEALNIPKNHPAKDEQDTFYINEDIVLRTQTSPVQIRYMENHKPPIRIIAPGKVFRSDAVDATHSPTFHQLEGLVVDKGITMADLKGALNAFVKELFGHDAVTRFRPHHFPFTEPSAEMDVQCFVCAGAGCNVCKGSGYIELLGCGMVHPEVLRRCGIDPEVYSGFAFGMGLERITLKRYKINDLRLLFENDINFLKQF